MKDWVLSQEWDQWSVKFDVRDLGGQLDTTFRGWSSTLATRVRLVLSRLVLIFILPLDFHGRVRVVRSMYLLAALHVIEASFLASGSLRKLRSAVCKVVWSRRQPFANVGAVLSLLDGPTGCDPAFCVVWYRFRLIRRYLALWPTEVGRVYRLLGMFCEGCPGHGPILLLSASAAEIAFKWGSHALAWTRPGLPLPWRESGACPWYLAVTVRCLPRRVQENWIVWCHSAVVLLVMTHFVLMFPSVVLRPRCSASWLV